MNTEIFVRCFSLLDRDCTHVYTGGFRGSAGNFWYRNNGTLLPFRGYTNFNPGMQGTGPEDNTLILFGPTGYKWMAGQEKAWTNNMCFMCELRPIDQGSNEGDGLDFTN